MRKLISVLLLFMAMLTTASAETKAERKARILTPTNDFSKAEQFEVYQGGSGSNLDRFDHSAFSLPSGALTFEQRSDFFVGNGIFDRPWVPAPSSTIASDGVGPYFNARSCQGCHVKDGRGHPPEENDTNMVSMLFALSDLHGRPDPLYGAQFQDLAIVGLESEGRVRVNYEYIDFTYDDGVIVELRKPTYSTETKLGDGVSLNPRIAPPMIGLGLVEAIAAEDILANADPEDANGDGFSGRAHITDTGEIGRFGWKATAPTVLIQTANAFSNDMGLSTRIHPAPWGDCTEDQTDCRDAFHGNTATEHEVVDDLLDLTRFYSANLAVPARRDVNDPDVLAGKALFYDIGCIGCHTPKFATSAKADPEQRNQLIWPYSDFLLHDLGEGLADQNPSGSIGGAEWRTQPLWGIGMTEIVNGHTYFLHDGRARSVEEAILWHGGEAEAVKGNFASLLAKERALILRFLESL